MFIFIESKRANIFRMAILSVLYVQSLSFMIFSENEKEKELLVITLKMQFLHLIVNIENCAKYAVNCTAVSHFLHLQLCLYYTLNFVFRVTSHVC